MATYQTPGVYVEEISTLPPSVAEVSTAIPAFIGYTQMGANQVARIDTLLEYEQRFGGASPTAFSVEAHIDADTGAHVIDSVSRDAGAGVTPGFAMYYSVSLYFKNGGGSCYIVSVGDYSAPPQKSTFEAGLAMVEREDEPTLIVQVDAINLAAADYYDLCQQALDQCKKLGDRFTIVDVKDGDVDGFRNANMADNLLYGAAYHPYLETTLEYHYLEGGVTVTDTTAPGDSPPAPMTLASLKTGQTALYNQVKKALSGPRVVLPPSAAMAGVYARVDRERGVWKAPANVGITSIAGPSSKITHDDQSRLNIDPTGGKSINAIRAFAGKGTLVWGARTLAGNDNEWRYVSVRRLFIMIEESAKKSTAFAVFEPNDATTWLKVKGMLESYLYGLWERGALQGATPEAAYFVNVGLGKTMTAQDVLEGRMIVELGIAAVRPAEFIILRFTHKLPEA